METANTIANQIQITQNKADAIKLLRARTHVYAVATRIMVFQFIFTVIVPILGAIATNIWAGSLAYVALISLIIIVIDPLIDQYYMALVKEAAKIAEQFDCMVLGILWDHFTVGDMVEPEDVRAADRSYGTGNESKLLNWYPQAVSQIPIYLARIVCQRTNLRYDSKLRRSYSVLTISIALVVVASLLISAVVRHLLVNDWVLSMMPAGPVLAWAFREHRRQRNTADLLDNLMKEAKTLWESALSGSSTPSDCDRKSREFQNAIYLRRSTSPLVFPGLYRLKRAHLEDEMNQGAEVWVRQYLDSLTAPKN